MRKEVPLERQVNPKDTAWLYGAQRRRPGSYPMFRRVGISRASRVPTTLPRPGSSVPRLASPTR